MMGAGHQVSAPANLGGFSVALRVGRIIDNSLGKKSGS